MSRILQELARSGYSFNPETDAALSRYWTHHVNRFGIYDLNLDRYLSTLDFEASIIPATASWRTYALNPASTRIFRASDPFLHESLPTPK